MKLTEDKFPILSCIKNNTLTEKIQEFLDAQIPNKEEQYDLASSFEFFDNKTLQINYISNSIHEKLINTSNFIKAKKLLKNSPKGQGLLLLPKTIYPVFKNVPEYVETDPEDFPIHAILYTWLDAHENDKLRGTYDENDPWDLDKDRELMLIPIYMNGTTMGAELQELMQVDDTYGMEYVESDDRGYYGNIQDYVMSFILFYHFTETETKIIYGVDSDEQRRIKVNGEKFINFSTNDIETICLFGPLSQK